MMRKNEIKRWVRRMQVRYRKHVGPESPVGYADTRMTRPHCPGLPLTRDLLREAQFHDLERAGDENEYWVGKNRRGRRKQTGQTHFMDGE